MCVQRFRPTNKGSRFFLRFGTGEPIKNINKEIDSLQKEFCLPSMVSSNARHVVETLKTTTGVEASSSAGTVYRYAVSNINV